MQIIWTYLPRYFGGPSNDIDRHESKVTVSPGWGFSQRTCRQIITAMWTILCVSRRTWLSTLEVHILSKLRWRNCRLDRSMNKKKKKNQSWNVSLNEMRTIGPVILWVLWKPLIITEPSKVWKDRIACLLGDVVTPQLQPGVVRLLQEAIILLQFLLQPLLGVHRWSRGTIEVIRTDFCFHVLKWPKNSQLHVPWWVGHLL